MLKFDIKGFINPDSIKRNSLARVDITINGYITPLTTNHEIEDHLSQRNPQAYWDDGTTPFGHMALGRALGPTGDSPLENLIIDDSLTHSNLAFRAFTDQSHHHSH
jgi:hypothetical protein